MSKLEQRAHRQGHGLLFNRYNHPHLELGSASRDVETAKFHKEPRPATADVAFPVD